MAEARESTATILIFSDTILDTVGVYSLYIRNSRFVPPVNKTEYFQKGDPK
jgi:hypothetical protein